jgi:hypothetical protein
MVVFAVHMCKLVQELRVGEIYVCHQHLLSFDIVHFGSALVDFSNSHHVTALATTQIRAGHLHEFQNRSCMSGQM